MEPKRSSFGFWGVEPAGLGLNLSEKREEVWSKIDMVRL